MLLASLWVEWLGLVLWGDVSGCRWGCCWCWVGQRMRRCWGGHVCGLQPTRAFSAGERGRWGWMCDDEGGG